MKKMLAIILSAVFCATSISACAAKTEDLTITLQINNPVMTVNGEEKPIDEQGTAPVIVNDRTLLPVRAVVEAMGGKVEWYGEMQTVILACGKDIIVLGINNTTAYHNNESHTLDAAPTIISLYAPLDGMNEKGLCAAVLYIEDGAEINQNTDKPDITTTTAIRLLLNQAAHVDEAVALLNQYDMHDSLGMMIHFAISDANGKCVAVEYINNEMVVTETPVVTNFYLAEGNKQGIGSSQSHTRFETLTNALTANPTMEADDVKNALESVSKHHFNDGETTEWSIVYNQAQGTAQYYHRENFDKSYLFKIQ